MWNKLNKSLMVCQLAFGLSFYGVMVILTRFFLEDLKYSEADTMMIVGAFSAIGPLFAIAGGFIADKFLGAYRSLVFSYFTFALVLGLIGLAAFMWTLKSGQYDDLDGAAERILLDDEDKPLPSKSPPKR